VSSNRCQNLFKSKTDQPPSFSLDLEFWLFDTSENRITIDKIFDVGPSEEAMLSCDYYFTIEDTISSECGVSHGHTACIEMTGFLLFEIDRIIIRLNLYMLQTCIILSTFQWAWDE
jgi:hypothetical protein